MHRTNTTILYVIYGLLCIVAEIFLPIYYLKTINHCNPNRDSVKIERRKMVDNGNGIDEGNDFLSVVNTEFLCL